VLRHKRLRTRRSRCSLLSGPVSEMSMAPLQTWLEGVGSTESSAHTLCRSIIPRQARRRNSGMSGLRLGLSGWKGSLRLTEAIVWHWQPQCHANGRAGNSWRSGDSHGVQELSGLLSLLSLCSVESTSFGLERSLTRSKLS